MTKHFSGMSNTNSSARQYSYENFVTPGLRTDETVGLMDLWALIKRRTWFIGIIVLACTLLATIATFTISKTYTARSAVVLERKDIRPFATDASLQSLDRDRSAAETEMDVLRSRQFAGRVVDRLKLSEDPSFNPDVRNVLEGEKSAQGILGYFTRYIKALKGSESAPVSSAEKQRDRAISTLLTQYAVKRTGESLAVEITESNQDPKLAANIANTIARLYVESSLEFKQDERSADKNRALSTRGAVGFLRQSITQPLLVTLRSEEARLQQVKDELAAKYGKNHPQIVAADSQLASVQTMIDTEVQRIILDLEAESLKPSARILSLAEIPISPSFPKPGIVIPIAFVGSAMLAFLMAILMEATDTRIRSGRRTSRLLHVPNFGYVPRISKNLLVSSARMPSLLAFRRSLTFTEAERSIYMASRFSDVDKPNGVIMITSCIGSKASASTAWGIAASAAADGRTALFMDLDFNNHIAVDMSESLRKSTLMERYLRDETFLVDVIQIVPNSPRLGFIDATGALREPSRSFNSKKLLEIFAAIKKIGYDFVVLHAPPVLAAGDANWLSPFVDGVILSATWGKTTEEQLLDAATQLRMNRAALIGTVIDEVDPKMHAKKGYGGSVLTAELVPATNFKQLSARDGSLE